MKILTLISFPSLSTLWTGNKVLPMWYPVSTINSVKKGSLVPVRFSGEDFVLYKNKENYTLIYDSCPHQGAKLSKGKLTAINTIKCCYHGFEFNEGSFVKIPTSNYFKPKICVPSLYTTTDNNFIYALPIDKQTTSLGSYPSLYVAPENNDRFRKITGSKIIEQNAEIITENVLDMLHISFVHSFGNRVYPLPFNIRFEKLDDYSGKTTFLYNSGSDSISSKVAQTNVVTVENEYYLPSTTVTRVIAGKFIKTVVTRTLPVDEKKSIMYWEIYRNFWLDNILIEPFGDLVFEFMMDKTLEEDIKVIQDIDHKKRVQGIRTIYDKTIFKYREAKEKAYSSILDCQS